MKSTTSKEIIHPVRSRLPRKTLLLWILSSLVIFLISFVANGRSGDDVALKYAVGIVAIWSVFYWLLFVVIRDLAEIR